MVNLKVKISQYYMEGQSILPMLVILNLDQVDGALVGGASLKSKDFSKIIDSTHN